MNLDWLEEAIEEAYDELVQAQDFQGALTAAVTRIKRRVQEAVSEDLKGLKGDLLKIVDRRIEVP